MAETEDRRTPSAVNLYDALTTAPDERVRARLIAEAFERLEEAAAPPADVATKGDVREAELRLQKEIEELRAEAQGEGERIRAEAQGEREQIRAEAQTEREQIRREGQTEREQIRREIEQLRTEAGGERERIRAEAQTEREQIRREIAHVYQKIEESRRSTIQWVSGIVLSAMAGQTAILAAAIVYALG